MFLTMALVSFSSFWLLLSHISPRVMRRIVGYKGWADLVLHVTVISLFLGGSTEGLLQAEAAAILFSISLRVYRRLFGYERLARDGWHRYAGIITAKALSHE